MAVPDYLQECGAGYLLVVGKSKGVNRRNSRPSFVFGVSRDSSQPDGVNAVSGDQSLGCFNRLDRIARLNQVVIIAHR